LAPSTQELIDDYARDFAFSLDFTTQMMSAFPIFWNHRYPELFDPDVGLCTYEPIQFSWIAIDGNDDTEVPPVVIPRPTGLTPLELYGQFLVYEPPIRDALNIQVLRILALLADEIEQLADTNPVTGKQFLADDLVDMTSAQFREYQERPTRIALILLEFLRTKFKFRDAEYSGEPNAKPALVTDLSIIDRALPLIPTHELFGETDIRHRVVLNGAIVAFAEFICQRKVFVLSEKAGMTGPLHLFEGIFTKVGERQTVFQELFENFETHVKLYQSRPTHEEIIDRMSEKPERKIDEPPNQQTGE
jgi:hypothetical protein